jgi:hypothetical protein
MRIFYSDANQLQKHLFVRLSAASVDSMSFECMELKCYHKFRLDEGYFFFPRKSDFFKKSIIILFL